MLDDQVVRPIQRPRTSPRRRKIGERKNESQNHRIKKRNNRLIQDNRKRQRNGKKGLKQPKFDSKNDGTVELIQIDKHNAEKLAGRIDELIVIEDKYAQYLIRVKITVIQSHAAPQPPQRFETAAVPILAGTNATILRAPNSGFVKLVLN